MSVTLAGVVKMDFENSGLLRVEVLMVGVTVLMKRFTGCRLHVHHKDTSDKIRWSNIHLFGVAELARAASQLARRATHSKLQNSHRSVHLINVVASTGHIESTVGPSR